MPSIRPEPVAAIVVAAGSGVRLGGSTAGGTGPKALRLLGGRPLVRHSVERLAAAGVTSCVVVVPAGAEGAFVTALAGVGVPVTLVAGGRERQESVAKGLALVGAEPLVLVHDAARPLVPVAVIRGVMDALRSGATAVVPAVPVTDSIRVVDGDRSRVVDRSGLRAVQTPQGFRADVLRAAHAAAAVGHTDDASVCEAAGHRVVLVPGSRHSIKITEPADFAFAEALLREDA